VKGTGEDDAGIIRIDFPGGSGEQSLEAITWEDFFEKFEQAKLAFLYQEGPDTRFNKLVSRDTVQQPSEGTEDQGSATAEPAVEAPRLHPKRPVQGLACGRGEVSGQRLWGWAQALFGTPEAFFRRFFVVNYCPLAFVEESGRNRTPDKLPVDERGPLFDACDDALRAVVDRLQPRLVVGVGAFARARAEQALEGRNVRIETVLHPSPASPAANLGWATCASEQFLKMGAIHGVNREDA
jgi:hypothetical protein